MHPSLSLLLMQSRELRQSPRCSYADMQAKYASATLWPRQGRKKQPKKGSGWCGAAELVHDEGRRAMGQAAEGRGIMSASIDR